MRTSNTAPLIFLGTCLGFAETTLGVLSGLVGLNVTLAAVFALSSLGMVLLALVAMYFRDPAFLTFNSQQALDLRTLELLRDRLTPELLGVYADSLVMRGKVEQTSPRGIVLSRRRGEETELEEFLESLED